MFYNNKRYNAIGSYLKKEFGYKVIKLSLDGGFSCPNRDGTLSNDGCIFCSEKGSGDFTSSSVLNINEQLTEQISLLKKKWPSGKYIAYFQSYTNTYGEINDLKTIFYQALSHPDVIGLAIATRPDCLSDDVLELLSELNKKTYLWIELGLQSIHEKTAILINRCYPLSTFERAVENLNKYNIRIVVHLIFGLPNESKDEILESVRYMSEKNIFGIKIHLLHVLENTRLAEIYEKGIFRTLEKDEYIQLVVDALELIPPNITIHRLTGDAPWRSLVAPKWSTDKKGILNGIDKELLKRNSRQGIQLKTENWQLKDNEEICL